MSAHGNLFERHSSEILDTQTHTTHSQTIRDGESKVITVSDGQVDAEMLLSDRMAQVSAADPLLLFLHFFSIWLNLDVHWEITIFPLLVFFIQCLSGLFEQEN